MTSLTLNVLSAHGTLPLVEEIQIEHLRIGRNLCGHSMGFKIDLCGDLFPLAVLPLAGVAREGEFAFRDRHF